MDQFEEVFLDGEGWGFEGGLRGAAGRGGGMGGGRGWGCLVDELEKEGSNIVVIEERH